jgi:galactokinase/mevalonate kinase-like predicted kinase
MISSTTLYTSNVRRSKQIESKKGRKYDLDRSSWTKYKKFKNMYSAIEEEMVEAGIAFSLDEPT